MEMGIITKNKRKWRAGGIPSGEHTEAKLDEINNRLKNIEKKLKIVEE